MPERFQPKTVATFHPHQLEKVISWAAKHGIRPLDERLLTETFRTLLDTVETDENGRPLNEKGRRRLVLAAAVIAKLVRGIAIGDDTFKHLRGSISVWQTQPDPNEVEIRWLSHDPLEHRSILEI